MNGEQGQYPEGIDRLSYNPAHDLRTVDPEAWARQWFSGFADLEPGSESYQTAERAIQGITGLDPSARDVDASDLGTVMERLRLFDSRNPYDPDAESAVERRRYEQWDRAYDLARFTGRQIVRTTLEDADKYAAFRVEQERSGTDYLSSVANDRGFFRYLQEQFGITDDPLRRNYAGEELAPIKITHLYCDGNGFREINNKLGHPIGDAAIVELAREVESLFREAEAPLVYRHGGDEFGIVLANLNDNDIDEMTRRIINAQTDKAMSRTYRKTVNLINERLQTTKQSGRPTRIEARWHKPTQAEIAAGSRPHQILYINGEPITELRSIITFAVGTASAEVSSRYDVEEIRRISDEAMRGAKRVFHGIIERSRTRSESA